MSDPAVGPRASDIAVAASDYVLGCKKEERDREREREGGGGGGGAERESWMHEGQRRPASQAAGATDAALET